MQRITLPDREELLARLLEIPGAGDNSFLQRKLFPLLLENAGQTRDAIGIFMMVAQVVYSATDGEADTVFFALELAVPEIIDALCVDEEVAAEAKEHYKQATAQ